MEKTNKKTNSNSNSGSIGTSISGFSEISDHEEDFLNFSKKIQEKEEELEFLRKQVRSLEYSAKRAKIEKENELEFWKLKAETLNQELFTQPLLQMANELQQKLSEKEFEVLSLKDSHLDLKRELFEMRERNLHLKNTTARHKSFTLIDNKDKRSFLKHENSIHKQSILNKIDEKPEYVGGFPTHDLLFGVIESLRGEKRALEENLNKIKEVAIDSVVEKEKELIEVKNCLEETEANYKNQLELATNELEILRMKLKYAEGEEEASSPKHKASLIQFRTLEAELETFRILYREDKIRFISEKETLDQKVRELLLLIETQENEFHKKLESVSREMDDLVYKKVREDTQNSKDLQQELLKELQASEEKFRELQRKYALSQQELRVLKENYEKDLNENNMKIKELTIKLSKYEKSEQGKIDLEKRSEGNKIKLLNEIEQKKDKIKEIESNKLEFAKKVTFLEGEINQYKMKNGLLKENCDNLKFENEELKTRLNEDFRTFQNSIAQLDLRYSQEKDSLEREIKYLKEMYESEGKNTMYETLRNDFENPSIGYNSNSNRGSSSPVLQKRVSILETYDNKEDLERVVAESDLYLDLKDEIDTHKGKIEELEEIIKDLNEKNDRLVESYKNEIEDLKENQKGNLNDLQSMRRTFIQKAEESPKEGELIKEVNRLKMDNFKLQTIFNENKQVYENEVTFLKNELIRSEEKMKSYKENYTKVVNERDVYAQKFNQISEHIKKKKKMLQNSENTGSFFGLRLSLFRR